jgi:hypothetical protein
MPRRKRRFESLEDRRLLTALAGPMTPAQSPAADVAEVAPASTAMATTPVSTTPGSTGASSDGADQVESQSDGDESDGSAEYASSQPASPSSGSPSSTGTTSASSNDYGSNYNNSSYDSPSSSGDSSSSKGRSTTPPTTALNLPSASEEATGPTNVASVLSSTLSLPTLEPGPSVTTSSQAARSPSASTISEPDAAGTSGELQGNDSLIDADLSAPVALASSATDFHRLAERAGRAEELPAHAEQIAPAAQVRGGAPIAGSAAVDLAAIEKGIDEVFDRIERLGDDLVGGDGATRFAEWLVIAGGACAAFEYARIRLREAAPWQTAGPGAVPYEPRLRRRWFGRRRRR